jgi:hypothetical protein
MDGSDERAQTLRSWTGRADRVLSWGAEPFLLVGIIASIKEIVVVAGAERPKDEGFETFRNGMIEVGVLSGVVLVLAVAALLLRMREDKPAEEDETPA